MYRVYFNEIPLLLNTTPKHIHALSHFCKSLKIPSPQIQILHSQPFKNSHSTSFIVELASTNPTRVRRGMVTIDIHGLSGKFPNVQNSPPLRRLSGARQVLLSSNESDELRRENRIALSCLVIVLCFFM
jgi:hypothetical protein